MKLTLRLFGFAFCIIPPVLAILDQYPILTPSARMSGMALLLIALSAVPLYKYGKELLKSPSAWFLWLCVLLFCLAANSVIDELIVVAAIAFPSSVIGAVCFYLSKKLGQKGGER